MGCSCKICLKITAAVPLLFLTICVLGATIALGVIGIERASESNPCLNKNDTNVVCSLPELLTPARNLTTNTTDPQPVVISFDENEFFYWLAGATGCGILFALIATLSLWALESAVYSIRKLSKPSKDLELKNVDKNATDGSPEPEPEPPKEIDKIGDQTLCEKPRVELRQLVTKKSMCSLVSLFLSNLFAVFALLCLLWGIAIAFNHTRRETIQVTPFIVVEFLVAVALPVFLIFSGIFMASVLDFITFGAVDPRKAIPRFLKSVKLETGDQYDHWIIESTFTFKLKKRKVEDRKKKGFCFSCYPNKATWILVAIIFLSLTLVISYFADFTLDEQVSVESCQDPRINRDFSCFRSGTLEFVDCRTSNTSDLIHCFRFYRFGVDVDLISALGTSYAFYLVTAAVFAHIFSALKILFSLHKSPTCWGVLFIVAGIVMVIGSILIFLTWLIGYISATQNELVRLNIINLSQFIMVSLFVILVGALIRSTNWSILRNDPKKKESAKKTD